MHYYEVLPLKTVHASDATLTYASSAELQPGHIVAVPVGKKAEVPAVVIKKTQKPSFQTREIIRQVESTALPQPLMKLGSWLSNYYTTHPVVTWQTILPRGLLKKRRAKQNIITHPKRKRTQIVLNSQQSNACKRILEATSGTALLHGITGSGKTEVYIQVAKETINAGRSAIILVPEIALTSQLIAEFTPHFPNVIVTHSTMTEAARHLTWQSILHSDEPLLIIGPRSALFSPVNNLGLIVIDECHEPSFKQESSPRYSALRAASVLASHADARLILGSATPSVTDYYLAKESGAPIIEMTRPARKNTVAPSVHVVDMTKKNHFSRNRYLSTTLIKTIDQTLKSGNQSLLFHNRRGTAPTTLCENCGWSALCPNCFVPLTLHADAFHLRCHICNLRERVPTHCPECQTTGVIHKGIGTKLLESEAKKLFPAAKIMRFDGDSESHETLEKQYQALYDGDIDIIIGTQVVAKGLDLPKLRTVGVVQADAGLSLPDYQSAERTFQLLAQVTGRVGRNEHDSTVVVQSYQPTHPAVKAGIAKDYHSFYAYAIDERKRAHFPPFTHLAKLTCSYASEQAAVKAARALASKLRTVTPNRVELLGPTPAFYERTRGSYRWQLIAKSPKRADLVDLMQHIPPTHWQTEIDPVSLL